MHALAWQHRRWRRWHGLALAGVSVLPLCGPWLRVVLPNFSFPTARLVCRPPSRIISSDRAVTFRSNRPVRCPCIVTDCLVFGRCHTADNYFSPVLAVMCDLVRCFWYGDAMHLRVFAACVLWWDCAQRRPEYPARNVSWEPLPCILVLIQYLGGGGAPIWGGRARRLWTWRVNNVINHGSRFYPQLYYVPRGRHVKDKKEDTHEARWNSETENVGAKRK